MASAKSSSNLKRALRLALRAVLAFYIFILASLVYLRFFNPFTTGVQTQRRVESWFKKGKYVKRQNQLPLDKISISLQHAVIAAEDGNFYTHHGFEWSQIEEAVDNATDDDPKTKVRGASTISQQLVKNLYFTTHSNPIRKALEITIVPLAELILGKRRILELYLNTSEWGPGIYGAEAAANFHYRTTAARLTRDPASRLAAILPSPRRRSPARMNRYSQIIQTRMSQKNW